MPKLNVQFAGEWRIIELDEFEDEYLEETVGKPFIRLNALNAESISGEYRCGLSSGNIDGVIRAFNGEKMVVFGFEGNDEMDAESGGGWMRVREDGSLEGEFIGSLGHFVAKRIAAEKKRPATKLSKTGARRR